MGNRRRFLLVDKDFQFSFALAVVLVVILLLNLLLLLGFFIFEPLQQFNFTYFHITAIAAVEFAIIAGVAFYSLKASRSMAGPVQGMIRGMNQLASGDLTVRLALRDGEFFDEMLTSFNDNVSELASRLAEARRISEELSAMDLHEEGVQERIDALHDILMRVKTE